MKKKSKENNSISFWKLLTGVWAAITLILFALDFFSGHQIDASTSAVGATYIAILGIFTGTKEFERWNVKTYESKYYGEIYIFIWTALILIFTIVPAFSQGRFKMPQEFIVTYIAVIGIFAISHRSKQMHSRRSLKRR